MPRIYLCFLWHMHQPFYKDLISGEYKLPWTRLHSLKDYYGMVRILEEFPNIRQTFNLVPSMMVQVEEYAAGVAKDPFLECALKPAETLSHDEQAFILQHFFNANPGRMIHRYPRFGELFGAWKAQEKESTGRGVFGVQEFRDIQVLSQLAWFDEEFQAHDPVIGGLITKGRDFSQDDQAAMGLKQRELLSLVIPEYKKLARSGQIEISTTPFYHPILPLLCDSDIAGVSHPQVTLPGRFQYPEDARKQLEMAHDYITRVFGVAPVGLWPSEGSVSDEVFAIGAECGFKWAATDNGVLERTLGRAAGPDVTYRSYLWRQRQNQLHVIFRDHLLSDLIGFVYSGMPARDAAADFLHRIRQNCSGILAAGRDALVPIILDGENAWEYYDRNGRPFFRELYASISTDPDMHAVTVREALELMPSEPIDHIFPGSWIGANFDVWIGAPEDNQAWELLREAREAYSAAVEVTAEERQLAYEELLIAEGSDWCWWYGPEHDSVNRIEFDQLFRAHIANVYRALKQMPPEELSRPIIHTTVNESNTSPSGRIKPVIDGAVTSYFEWLGAGIYRVDERTGSMHGKRFVVREFHYGSDGERIYVRIDFHPESGDLLAGLDARFTLRSGGSDVQSTFDIHIQDGRAATGNKDVDCAYQTILEVAIALNGMKPNGSVQLHASFWNGGLPVDALPPAGWLDIATEERTDWVA